MPSSLTGPTQPRAMLEVVRDGVVATTVPLYAGSLHIGRDMGNDLVLVDADVSNHHAVIVLEGSSARVVDLKSTNGTFLNGRRISESTALVDRDILRFGRTAIARVTVIPIAHQPPPFVMDLTSGLRHAFETDRFTVGSDHGCDLVVPDADALVATLIVHPSGEVWLGSEDAEDAPLELGAEFDLAGHRLRLDPPDLERTPTYRAPTATTWPYHLRVALDLPGGPVATLIDTTRDRRHQVSAENRAVLLYVLARKLVADRAQGVDDALAGWCDDDEVVTGVWGRTGPPALNLLLHRLRKELRAAGFDPWFLEKRKGAVRVRLAAVDLDSSEVS